MGIKRLSAYERLRINSSRHGWGVSTIAKQYHHRDTCSVNVEIEWAIYSYICGLDLRTFRQFKLTLGDVSRMLRSVCAFGNPGCLLAYFGKSNQVKYSQGKGDEDAACLHPRFKFSPIGITLSILGVIIFAPSWVKLRSLRDYNREWLNWLTVTCIICGLSMFCCGLYLLLERAQIICESTQGTQRPILAAVHAPRLRFALRSGWSRSGGALRTFLSSRRNFRYAGVCAMSDFSSSALSFGFGSDITPPPDWSEYSTSGAYRLPTQALSQSAPAKLVPARYNGTLAHRGI